MSVIKAIFGAIRRNIRWFVQFFQWIKGLSQSILTWFIVGLVWLVHQLYSWIGDAWYDFWADAAEITFGQFGSAPLAHWLGRDVLALNVAWECVILGVFFWFAHRLSRLAISILRVLIDLL